jgi:UDP-glucose 4-epimerase
MMHSRFGVVNWFVRLALDNDTIQLYGDGSILRDFCYVDDCVDAIVRSAITPAAYGEIFNVGSPVPVSFRQLVETIVAEAKQGSWTFAEFSAERKAQEPGDFYSDVSKIARIVGWKPTTDLVAGLNKTLEFYRQYRDHYWQTKEPAPTAQAVLTPAAVAAGHHKR